MADDNDTPEADDSDVSLDDMPTATLWQRLLWIKRLFNWSEQRFAEKTSVSKSYLNKVISRKQRDMRRDTADKIGSVTGVSAVWIMTGTGPRRPFQPSPRRDYPSKYQAAEAARLVGVSDSAIARVMASSESHANDPGAGHWLRLMQFEDSRDSGTFPPATRS